MIDWRAAKAGPDHPRVDRLMVDVFVTTNGISA